MHTIDIVQTVAFLAAFVALASRLFVASRPFWSRLPAWAQTLLPVLVPTLTAAAQGLTGVKSWSDLSVLFVVSAGMLLPGLPSNRSAAPLQAGKESKKEPSAGDVAVAESMIAKASIAPPSNGQRMFPSSIPPALALLLAIGFAFHAQGCASSQAGACDPADAVRITEKYRAGMSVQCKGYTFADCPHRDELEAQRDKELEAACSSK